MYHITNCCPVVFKDYSSQLMWSGSLCHSCTMYIVSFISCTLHKSFVHRTDYK